MLRRARQLRDRLDVLRRRIDPVRGRVSATPEEAAERLARALDDHLGRREESRATADRLLDGLDMVPQGIVLADASGAIVFRNRAASLFVSARHGDALVEQAIDELLALAAAGEAGERTLELFGPPRRALQLRSIALRPESGEPERSGAFLVIEDVSERQRLDAVRRDFVANISHELKTPVGALGVLAEALSGETDPEIIEHLTARMRREAFRVASTIDDLLELSQLEGAEPPEREAVAVERILAEAVERTEEAAGQRRVQLVVEPVPASLAVLGDRRQLVSAVTGLCDNAVKYSDAGAEVHLRAKQAGDDVEIDVVDHGIGIPARDLERVFERFYRVDRARSRHTGGTGLGLAIVRHVVQNHAGRISLTSREGEGSTFTLHLPSPAPARPARPDGGPDPTPTDELDRAEPRPTRSP